MNDEVAEPETAVEIAKEYADTECVGEPDDVLKVEEEDRDWVVELRTHTFSRAYTHRIRITKPVGNVVSHDRVD